MKEIKTRGASVYEVLGGDILGVVDGFLKGFEDCFGIFKRDLGDFWAEGCEIKDNFGVKLDVGRDGDIWGGF